MKIFYGYDLTENKKNKTKLGGEFIVKKPNADTVKRFNGYHAELDKKMDRAMLPTWLSIALTVATAIGIIILQVMAKKDETHSFKLAYSQMPWLFWIAVAFILSGIASVLFTIFRAKRVFSSEEYDRIYSKICNLEKVILSETEVPDTAVNTDILEVKYKTKNGKIKFIKDKKTKALCRARNFAAYSDGKCLYLTDITGKYAFPLASVKGIKKVKKHFTAFDWNKDESPLDAPYKGTGVKIGKNGFTAFKISYALTFDINDEEWRIYFPCYELKALERLTGITVEE